MQLHFLMQKIFLNEILFYLIELFYVKELFVQIFQSLYINKTYIDVNHISILRLTHFLTRHGHRDSTKFNLGQSVKSVLDHCISTILNIKLNFVRR